MDLIAEPHDGHSRSAMATGYPDSRQSSLCGAVRRLGAGMGDLRDCSSPSRAQVSWPSPVMRCPLRSR
jgi:hypothetical protein